MQNTVLRMKEEKVHVAALITGGFHSEGISKLMDEEKLSYLVVMPKFDENSPDRPYIAILTQKPKEYEEAFKDSDFYLAAQVMFDLSADPASSRDLLDMALAVTLFYAKSSIGTLTDDAKNLYYENYARFYEQSGRRGAVTPDQLKELLGKAFIQRRNGLDVVSLGDKTFEIRSGKNEIEDIRVVQGGVDQETQAKDELEQIKARIAKLETKLSKPEPNESDFQKIIDR